MTQNRICSLLGIRYPIIQAPMNWVSGAALTAAGGSVASRAASQRKADAKAAEENLKAKKTNSYD